MLTLYGLTEFAAEIPGMDRIKLSVYYKRGKLPEPYAKAGNRPLWNWIQIQQYKLSLLPPVQRRPENQPKIIDKVKIEWFGITTLKGFVPEENHDKIRANFPSGLFLTGTEILRIQDYFKNIKTSQP